MLGFPCNQFGKQEPGSDAEILEFVTSRFDVDFPMFSKIDVNGEQEAPLFAWLKAQQPGDSGDIRWNFAKFLVNAEGEAVARWGPQVTPEQIGAELDRYR